jgi:hypothetical protein
VNKSLLRIALGVLAGVSLMVAYVRIHEAQNDRLSFCELTGCDDLQPVSVERFTQFLTPLKTSTADSDTCRDMVEIANIAVSTVKAINENDSITKLESMQKIGGIAYAASVSMQGLELDDPQLKEYQSRFVGMYADTYKASGNLVAAAQDKDAAAAQTAFDALKAATAQEGRLVADVNGYCKF